MSGQPVTVEEALKLFNEVQQLTVRDAQDSERFGVGEGGGTGGGSGTGRTSNASTTAAASGGLRRNNSGTNQRTASNSGGGVRNSGPQTTESELRRQIELSEAGMKKLHARNKALQQEVDDLKAGGAVPRGTPRGGDGDALLRKKVNEQDAIIKQLRQELAAELP